MAAMIASVKIDGAHVEVVPDRGARLDILVRRLKMLPCGIRLLSSACCRSSAVAQITGPLLPYAVPINVPQLPAPGERPISPGETVTSRPRPEFDPIGLRFGDFFWFPRAELDEAYNSNIFATTTSPTYDLITALQPSFDLLSNFPRNALNLHGSSAAAGLCRPSGAKHSGRHHQRGRTARRDRRELVLRQRTGGAPAHILRVSQFARQHCSAGDVLGLHCYSRLCARGDDAFPTKSMSVWTAAQYNAAPLVGGGVLPQSSQDATISDCSGSR